MGKHQRTDLDHARDELMSHIHRCGVLKASPEQQQQWLDETMQYMSERYTGLSREDLGQLQEIGKRFCQPVIPHGADHSAIESKDDDAAEATEATETTAEANADSEEKEMVGAA